VKVEKGDTLVLAVDARDGNHVCDMTEVGFTVAEAEKPGRSWDLAGDVWSNVQSGNPHADKHGNADTWSFARGPSKGRTSAAAAPVVEVRLPAALFVGRDFVVDAGLDGPAGDRLVRVRAATTPPGPRWDGPVLAAATGAGYRELTRGHADFRRVFPLYTCFP